MSHFKKLAALCSLLIVITLITSACSDTDNNKFQGSIREFNLTGEGANLIGETLPLQYENGTGWIATYSVNKNPVQVFKKYVNKFKDEGYRPVAANWTGTYFDVDIAIYLPSHENTTAEEYPESLKRGCYARRIDWENKDKKAVSCGMSLLSADNKTLIRIFLERGRSWEKDNLYPGMQIQSTTTGGIGETYYSYPELVDTKEGLIEASKFKLKEKYPVVPNDKLVPLPEVDPKHEYTYAGYSGLIYSQRIEDFTKNLEPLYSYIPNDCDSTGSTRLYEADKDLSKQLFQYFVGDHQDVLTQYDDAYLETPNQQEVKNIRLKSNTKWDSVKRISYRPSDDGGYYVWFFNSPNKHLILYNVCNNPD